MDIEPGADPFSASEACRSPLRFTLFAFTKNERFSPILALFAQFLNNVWGTFYLRFLILLINPAFGMPV